MKWPVALLAIAMVAGTATLAVADEHNIAPISVITDSESYSDGDTIVVSGAIKDMDETFVCGVTVQVWDPTGNLVRIAQTSPADDGTYEVSFVAGGPQWKESGDYGISVKCNADDMSTTVAFTAAPLECEEGFENIDNECVEIIVECGEGFENIDNECVEIIVECGEGFENIDNECVEIVPPVVCGEGTELVDGVCQVVRPPPPPAAPVTCEEGFENVDGVCVEIAPLECGPGTELVDGICQVVEPEPEPPTTGGGSCLIATAAYGTEMAAQVQYLREIRDGTLMSTSAGSSFMSAFNEAYYTVSPQIADMERQSPVFREMVRIAVTPLLASLSLMGLAEEGSEASVLGMGVLVIALNAGMYVGMPALLAFKAYGKVRAVRRGD